MKETQKIERKGWKEGRKQAKTDNNKNREKKQPTNYTSPHQCVVLGILLHRNETI